MNEERKEIERREGQDEGSRVVFERGSVENDGEGCDRKGG